MSPEEEAFEQGFHGLPSPKERARMSAERLAILLCEQIVLTSSQVPPQPEAKTRQPTAEKTADETTKAVADVNAPVRVPPPMPNTPTSKSSTEPQKSDTKK